MAILNTLMFLLSMLIVWSVLFASGSDGFYGVAINGTMNDAAVPGYFKVGLDILPAVGYLGIIFTAWYMFQGRGTDQGYAG